MKIFISHSARDDPFAQLLLETVKPLLDGHEVFLDADVLETGDDWCSVLYHWLAECHAAVVLLNRKALASRWVHREVNILLWRRALGYPLEMLNIVPVIIGDLSEKDVDDAGFGELTAIQMAHRDLAQQAQEAARQLAEDIAGKLGGTTAAADHSAMARWAQVVSAQLSLVTSQDSLVDAARMLGVEENYLGHVRDPRQGPRFLAHQLLASGHGRAIDRAIEQLADFMLDEPLARLIRKVSATWVNGESARELLAFRAGQPGTVVLNARAQRTAEQYIDRATCYAPSGFEYAAVTAVAGESFLEEFEQLCVKAVEYLLGVEPPFTIEESLPPDNVLYLIVDPASTRLDLVAQGMRAVQRRFPWLVMVLITGTAMPTDDDLRTWQLADALRLEPELAPADEATAQQVFAGLRKAYTRVSGRPLAGAA
jgi:hypothetical protein